MRRISIFMHRAGVFALARRWNLIQVRHIHRSALNDNSRSDLIKSCKIFVSKEVRYRTQSGMAERRLPAFEVVRGERVLDKVQ